jgi:hypothetical protein
MALIRTLLMLGLCLVSSRSFGDEGGYVDPCEGGPLETRSVLRCRDGDPTCDMDGICDGTCLVRTCIVQPKNPASCLVTGRFCPRASSSSFVDSKDGPWLIPVGDKKTLRFHATLVGAVCKPARRRCVPPSLPPCRVEVTGDVTASWSCQARLIATGPDRAVPEQYVIRLSEIGGRRSLQVLVNGAGVPAAATWTSDLPDRRVYSMSLSTESDYIHADNYDPPRLGSLDASLVLATVGQSKTPYHEAHGSFDATAVGVSGADPAARPALVVHAEF